jgi:hypothetical protein
MLGLKMLQYISNSSPTLGETLTITVEGYTGNIGNGGVPDYDSIWLTPAAVSSWPTRALKLSKVEIIFDDNNNGWSSTPTFTDQLLITNANVNATGVDNSYYIAKYYFKVIGKPAGSVLAVPVAQIASGTQMKHSDTTATGSTATLIFSSFTIPQTIQKAISSLSNLETGTASTISGANPGVTYVAIPYVETITSTSSSTFTVDEIVDQPSSSAIFYSGSTRITDATRTNAAIADPTYLASEASISPRPIHFVGPFQGSSARTVVLTYKLWLPANGSTYSNTAYALIGDQKIGSSASAIPKVNATTTSGSGSISAVVTTESLAPEATTDPASGVDTRTATLNGTIDANANAGTVKFQYGTSASLSSYTEVVATTPASGTLTTSDTVPVTTSRAITGLSTGTTYYFRVLIDSSTTRLATGDILSFTTTVPVASPTVTTTAADSITATTARLNGTINPNNTSVGFIYIEYGTTSNLSGSTTNLEVFEGDGATSATASGPTTIEFSRYISSGLVSGTTYYYRLVGCAAQKGGSIDCSSAGTTYLGNIVSFNTARTAQTITLNSINNQTFGATGITTTANSTSKLTVEVTSLTTGICTISTTVGGVDTTTSIALTIVNTGDCVLEATQSGGTIGGDTYNAATPTQISFNIAPATLTVTAANVSRITTDAAPTFTSTVTGFVYTDAGTFSSAIYQFTGKSGTSYPTSSTEPSSSTPGTYSVYPSSPTITFSSGSASNYIINPIAGTYTITAASLQNQTIAINNYATLYNGETLTVSSLVTNFGSGSGEITYTVASGDCTISGATVTATSASGTCVVTATKAADTTYNSATANSTITLGTRPGIDQTITLSGATVTYGSTVNLTTLLTDGAGSGAVTYSVTAGASGCSISSTTLTALIATGTCTVQASKAAGGGYNAATTTATITLGKRLITIKASDRSKTAGQSDPAFTGYSITSGTFYSSDTITAVTASRNAGETAGTYTITISAETFSPTSLSDSYTVTRATGVFTINAEGTYSITIEPATGGSGSSSAATVSSGGSVTLTATASSGYTFSSWSCTGGGTLSSSTANPATLSNITANATCTPVFTQNSSGGGGGGGGGVGPVGRASNKIVVTRVINTQPINTTTGSRPVFNGTNTTLTPGNSANRTSTILPTAATSTTSTGGVIAVVTNPSSQAPVNNPNQSAASQGVAAINTSNTSSQTIFERRADLPSSVVVNRDSNNRIQVSANNGWTGRVAVAVVNGSSDSDVETFVEVVVAPTPAVAPQIIQEQPPAIQKAEEKPKPGLVINWAPSQSEVVGYVVTVNSQPACFSMTTSCEINQLIGPKTKVAVIAQGNDNVFSAPVDLPAFKPARPIPALVVNFAVASSVLTPKFKADLRDLAKVMVKEGFTKVDIAGHTDSTGQAVSYNNQRLSDARAKATLNYLKRFVPRLKSVTGAYAFEKRITNEGNADELYANRRAEVSVS